MWRLLFVEKKSVVEPVAWSDAPPSVQKWSPDSNDRSTHKRYKLSIVHLYQHTWHYFHQFAPRKNQVYKQAKATNLGTAKQVKLTKKRTWVSYKSMVCNTAALGHVQHLQAHPWMFSQCVVPSLHPTINTMSNYTLWYSPSQSNFLHLFLFSC